MEITGGINVFLVGSAGGFIAELLHWWNLRTAGKLPDYASSIFYWLVTFLMILSGGFLCFLQFGQSVEALTALQVGLATPIVIQKLTTAIGPSGARGGTSLQSFFRW